MQIRDHDNDVIGTKHAAHISRTINSVFNVVAVEAKAKEAVPGAIAPPSRSRFVMVGGIPPMKMTHRGGRLPMEHRHFFQSRAQVPCETEIFEDIPDEKKYRAPMFLATSEQQATAKDFAQKNSQSTGDGVHWIFHFPTGTVDEAT